LVLEEQRTKATATTLYSPRLHQQEVAEERTTMKAETLVVLAVAVLLLELVAQEHLDRGTQAETATGTMVSLVQVLVAVVQVQQVRTRRLTVKVVQAVRVSPQRLLVHP
jgi:hypothetical protein